MPYIASEKVAEIRNEIKKQFPDFKFSITHQHYSTVVVSLMAGPIEFAETHRQLNPFHIEAHWKDEPDKMTMFLSIVDIIKKIGNHNPCIVEDGDYGRVPSFYYDINIGRWDKPYQYIPKKERAAVLQVVPGATTVEIKHNQRLNGVEIHFSGKPSEEIRGNLKASGFRWSKFNKCWYANISDNTVATAASYGVLPESLTPALPVPPEMEEWEGEEETEQEPLFS